jgi:hypothetical protein
MDVKSDLLKEAIADAKAVKETALANAKIALEEAFAPRIQSMLSAKLAEEMHEDEEDSSMDAPVDEHMIDPAALPYVDDEAGEVSAEPELDAEMGAEEPMVDDMAMEGMHEDEKEVDTEGMYQEDAGIEEDLELEAIIRELEEDLNEEELTEEELTEEEIAEDAHNKDAADSTDSKGNDLMSEPKEMKNEEFNIDEIIEGILAEDEELNEDEVVEEGMHEDEKEKEKVEELAEELTEAYDTIESLRDTINEVNLLNAKLLYTNKLFRNFELSEDQKMKVIENFDRAVNTREVKLVFSTLAENFTVPVKKRKVVKEGIASKPVQSTAPKTKTIINEGNQLADRWKKLAGLLD